MFDGDPRGKVRRGQYTCTLILSRCLGGNCYNTMIFLLILELLCVEAIVVVVVVVVVCVVCFGCFGCWLF